MALPVSMQLRQVLLSFGVGIALGCVYDILRVMRFYIRRSSFTIFADAVFWIITGWVLFLFGMSVGGGQLRLFMVSFAAIGAAFYAQTLSRHVFTALKKVSNSINKILQKILRPIMAILTKINKLQKNLKNLFQNRKNWFRIKKNKVCKIRQNVHQRTKGGGGREI